MTFDKFYSRNSSYFSTDHSDGLERCIKNYSIPTGKAIDIGAGEGRNSLYLAELGFDVTAVEPSVIGASKIKSSASALGVNINVINDDFLNATSKYDCESVDFIVAITSLEHMEYDYLQKAIKRIKRITKKGGYIYIVVFTTEDPGYKKDFANASECSNFVKHYFTPAELKHYFMDYDIIEYSEYIKEDNTHGLPHYHGKAKLLSKKK